MKHLKVLIILAFFNIYAFSYSGFLTKNIAQQISKIGTSNFSLSNEDIIKLSKLSDNKQGTQHIKKYIGNLNLPQSAREDLYLRIAIFQNKLSREEAISMMNNLKGVDGFDSSLSKIIGNNPQGVIGHLNEIRIANEGAKLGLTPIAIGKKFDDGTKKSLTDIDILLRKNNKDILIEAKNYQATTKMPLDKFRGDLDTLNIYGNNISKGKSIKVFSFTNKPDNLDLLRQYEFWAKQKGVQLIFGTPQEQIEQIKMLEKIL